MNLEQWFSEKVNGGLETSFQDLHVEGVQAGVTSSGYLQFINDIREVCKRMDIKEAQGGKRKTLFYKDKGSEEDKPTEIKLSLAIRKTYEFLLHASHDELIEVKLKDLYNILVGRGYPYCYNYFTEHLRGLRKAGVVNVISHERYARTIEIIVDLNGQTPQLFKRGSDGYESGDDPVEYIGDTPTKDAVKDIWEYLSDLIEFKENLEQQGTSLTSNAKVLLDNIYRLEQRLIKIEKDLYGYSVEAS
jgi:hypothetical protein